MELSSAKIIAGCKSLKSLCCINANTIAMKQINKASILPMNDHRLAVDELA